MRRSASQFSALTNELKLQRNTFRMFRVIRKSEWKANNQLKTQNHHAPAAEHLQNKVFHFCSDNFFSFVSQSKRFDVDFYPRRKFYPPPFFSSFLCVCVFTLIFFFFVFFSI